ncbi:helix-turn-helix transcriptional regulator [uncultured Draconibacterium sp.]|uniref:helix-turn-helix domain-containing protein n=1 Tax=uncultured Draconibacterium sp. TaxID=1573823 RepID=UPI0029C9AB72|nr:helix-turn-helix transcriptional regulator [uncultured Draconibacterium sp.]
MKKYYSLSELLVDYRKHRQLTQIDFAAMLDVDVRTVIRWEKNESLIKADKERILIENMGIPHQVVRNLNTEQPIPVYFDFKRWLYSLTLLSSVVKSAKEFKTDEELHTTRIVSLTDDKDFDFITYIQQNQKNCNPLSRDVIKTATRLLPGLNFVIRDQSGYHGGHVSILPLKYEVYEKIRDQKMLENQLTTNDLARHNDEDTPVFYFYSIYSNSLDNTYYLINKMLFYFKKREELKNYILAGVTFQNLKVDHFRQMGFQVIWEKNVDGHPDHHATFLSGNFNRFFSNEIEFF